MGRKLAVVLVLAVIGLSLIATGAFAGTTCQQLIDKCKQKCRPTTTTCPTTTTTCPTTTTTTCPTTTTTTSPTTTTTRISVAVAEKVVAKAAPKARIRREVQVLPFTGLPVNPLFPALAGIALLAVSGIRSSRHKDDN